MTEVLAPTPIPQLKVKPILAEPLKPSNTPISTEFDPERHLNFVEHPKCLSMKDLALPEDAGISKIACSEPFPLFSEEAIGIMRQEIFSTAVWENCLFSTEFAACQLRGHCPKYAPFMTAAWKDQKTLDIISKVAGLDLVLNMEYEIGNINVAVHNADDLAGVPKGLSVTKWHYDSYPIVCVVMLSDAREMAGGETAVRTGTGEILKVRGPQMGSAVVLQGRYVNHQALAALGAKERITMISAFRPRDPLIKDDSVLTSIRPISNLSEIYYQWTKYRVELVQARLKHMLELLERHHDAERPTDVKAIKEALRQQEEFLAITNNEIWET